MSNLSDAEDSDDGDVSSSTRELHERMELGVTRVLQGLQRQLQAPTLDPAYPAALNQTVALLSAMAQVLDAHVRRGLMYREKLKLRACGRGQGRTPRSIPI